MTPSPSPLRAAVTRILNSENDQNTIEWESCASIWDSSNSINADAAENEVSVYGLGGNLISPDGASRSFSVRQCFEFEERPSYYVRVSLGEGHRESRVVEDFTVLDSHLGAARLTFENIVQQFTRRFKDHGSIGVAQWFFGGEPSGPQVNGVNGLH